MSFFACSDGLTPSISSEPTIPLIRTRQFYLSSRKEKD